MIILHSVFDEIISLKPDQSITGCQYLSAEADVYDALDEEVAELLDDAARPADANDRKTVQPRDL